jgi:hypothetical protein
MRVLKKGREQKGWATEATCTGKGNGNGGCGALLLVEQGDLFHTYRCARDETDTFTTFRCCECGVLTDIDVPSHIQVAKDEAHTKPYPPPD